MSVTKERILEAALNLFARDGYAGVSMADIAGELGITKGALYRHYAGKRDIFESILQRMEQMDAENAENNGVPAEPIEKDAPSYRDTEIESILAYSEEMFRYWTQNPFASAFRRMLALEQYRDGEMARLYSQYIIGGPLKYMTDLFREMTARGCWREDDPMQLALEFYGPMTLLMAVADGPEGSEAPELLRAHLRRFIERHRA